MRRAVFALLTIAGLYGCYDYTLPAEENPTAEATPGTSGGGSGEAGGSSDPLTPNSRGDDDAVGAPEPSSETTSSSSSSSSSGDPTTPPADATPDAGSPAPPPAGCMFGQTYCGGGRVAGDRASLYRCMPDGKTGELVAKCASSCTTNQPAAQDACGAPTKCVVNGTYCGGDKVNGDPNVLYRCVGDGFTAIIQTRCTRGCVVAPPGNDDYCN
ncbi:MAG: hypothetical protein KIT84_41435 [Labilithrix sp.]|nr:hypothetical protein [Labilithrix sp.]MCW5817535.1 hypothetical protein [Labilithrix sp.]